jgi:hydroxymethylglutaryl-CoA lyase
MSDQVTICEMSARDGMQVLNRSGRVPFEMRLALLRALERARLPYIEVGSFVSPKIFPHLQDTPELFRDAHDATYRGQLAGLMPNLRYYEQFKDTPNLMTAAVFVSASEEYSQKNKNISIHDDLADAKRIAEVARQQGHRVRAHLSGAFRDPIRSDTQTDPDFVRQMCQELIRAGCETVALADTSGRATPPDIQRTIAHLVSHEIDLARIGVHLHDRFDHAMANAWEAYRLGVRTFDSALGGIGGNPSVIDSVGNLATERLVQFFTLMGVETGIDLAALKQALTIVYRMTQLVGDPPPSSSRLMHEILAEGGA